MPKVPSPAWMYLLDVPLEALGAAESFVTIPTPVVLLPCVRLGVPGVQVHNS